MLHKKLLDILKIRYKININFTYQFNKSQHSFGADLSRIHRILQINAINLSKFFRAINFTRATQRRAVATRDNARPSLCKY